MIGQKGDERDLRGGYGRFWGGMLDGWVGLVVWRSCCGDDVGLDLACVDVEEGIKSSSSSSNQVFGGDRASIRDRASFPSLQDERSIVEESRTVSRSQSWHKRYIVNNLPTVIIASKQYLPGWSYGAELAFFAGSYLSLDNSFWPSMSRIAIASPALTYSVRPVEAGGIVTVYSGYRVCREHRTSSSVDL